MGNSVTKTVEICPDNYTYNSKTKKCISSSDNKSISPIKLTLKKPHLATLNASEIGNSCYYGNLIPTNSGKYMFLTGIDTVDSKASVLSSKVGVEYYIVQNNKKIKISTTKYFDEMYFSAPDSLLTIVSRVYIIDKDGKKIYSSYSDIFTFGKKTNCKYSS